MALIECQDCRAQVSSEAAACPHCGRPVKLDQTGSGTRSNVRPGTVVCALMVVLGIGAIVNGVINFFTLGMVLCGGAILFWRLTLDVFGGRRSDRLK